MRLGNCYGATEALYYLLGGKDSDWQVMRLKTEEYSHWYLQHKTTNIILDVTSKQFETLPDYSKGKRASFYPNLSNRARFLSDIILWRDRIENVMHLSFNG